MITMKMISSTSITSTMGVTLISDVTSGAFFCFMYLSFICHSSISARAISGRSGQRGTTGIAQAAPRWISTREQLPARQPCKQQGANYFPAPAFCVRLRK